MLSNKGRKGKGSDAERELVRLFWDNGWAAIRVAGSGSSSFPSPDVLASSSGKNRTLAIECKSTSQNHKTLTKEELDQLKKFAELFGAEPWAAVRFDIGWPVVGEGDAGDTDPAGTGTGPPGEKWRFVSLQELEENNRQTISKAFADTNGFGFEELIGNL